MNRNHTQTNVSVKAKMKHKTDIGFVPNIPYDIPPAEFHRMYQYAKRNQKNPISWTFQRPVEADELIHRAEWIEANKEWEFEKQ